MVERFIHCCFVDTWNVNHTRASESCLFQAFWRTSWRILSGGEWSSRFSVLFLWKSPSPYEPRAVKCCFLKRRRPHFLLKLYIGCCGNLFYKLNALAGTDKLMVKECECLLRRQFIWPFSMLYYHEGKWVRCPEVGEGEGKGGVLFSFSLRPSPFLFVAISSEGCCAVNLSFWGSMGESICGNEIGKLCHIMQESSHWGMRVGRGECKESYRSLRIFHIIPVERRVQFVIKEK